MTTTYKIKIPRLKLSAPPFKPRSEFETEKLLNLYKAVARRRRIDLMIDDLNINQEPYNLSSYTNKEKRKSIVKSLLSLIKELVV